MEIVISRYKENLDWIKLISNNHKITIYNKGHFDDKYINITNIGREAHTYLHHIIVNYEKLEKYTCFLQGNPIDHLSIKINEIDNILENNPSFLSLNNNLITCDIDGNPHHPYLDIDNIFSKFFIKSMDKFEFSPGAQFIVNRENILNRRKEFYIDMISEFYRKDIDDFFHKSNKMPWLMERIWHYIFNPEFKTYYDI